MTTSETVIPSLRFPSFKGPWKPMELHGAIKSIDSGWSPQCAAEPAADGQWGILKTTSVSWDGYNDQANKRLLAGCVPRKEIEVKERDILVTRAGPSERVGVVAHVDRTRSMLMLSDKIIRLRCNDNSDSNFIARCLGSSKAQAHLVGRKSGLAKSQTNISQKDLMGVRLRIPTLPEQRKIADFLTAVDGRIQQLSQKKALLEDYKKGVMQQLFTQALRFKDNHGNEFPDWEEKTLGAVTKWSSGGTPAKDKPEYWQGDIPWMTAASMHSRYYEDSPLKITQEGLRNGSRITQRGSILLLVRGSMLWNRIPVGIAIRDVAFNQDVKALAPSGEVIAPFLLQWFIASENKLLHTVVGTGIGAGKLDTDGMKSMELLLPSLAEQTKIANFLTALDRKIESVAHQITHTQTFKKGLLQQMFV